MRNAVIKWIVPKESLLLEDKRDHTGYGSQAGRFEGFVPTFKM